MRLADGERKDRPAGSGEGGDKNERDGLDHEAAAGPGLSTNTRQRPGQQKLASPLRPELDTSAAEASPPPLPALDQWQHASADNAAETAVSLCSTHAGAEQTESGGKQEHTVAKKAEGEREIHRQLQLQRGAIRQHMCVKWATTCRHTGKQDIAEHTHT